MANDKVTNLYNAFIKGGYAMESEAEFRKNLQDPKKRKAAYDALVKDGYDMEPFDRFEANIGYGAKPAAASSAKPAAKPAAAPVPQNIRQVQGNVKQIIAGAYDIARKGQQMPQTQGAGQHARQTVKPAVQAASVPRSAPKGGDFLDEVKAAVNGAMNTAKKKAANAQSAPKGDGKKFIWEFDNPKERLKNRMENYGLNPESKEDVQKMFLADAMVSGRGLDKKTRAELQATMDGYGLDSGLRSHVLMALEGDTRKIAAHRLKQAEQRLRLLMNEWSRVEDKRRNEGSFLERLGHSVNVANSNMHPTDNEGKARTKLDKDIEEATAEVAMLSQELRKYDQQRAAAGGNWAMNTLRGLWNGITDPNALTMGVYDLSVNRTAREAADTPEGRDKDVVRSAMTSRQLKSEAPDPGGFYSGGRFIGEMLVDPITDISGCAGSVARQLVTDGAVKVLGKGMAKEVAERYLGNTLVGRLATRYAPRAIGAGVNFSAFEGLRDARQQLTDGGYYDDEGQFHEGFSWGHTLKSGGHGFLMGSAMGIFGAGVGNAGDYLVGKAGEAGAGALGKGAIRAGQHAVSLVGEGTIFAMPEMIEFHTMDDEKFDRLYAEKFGYDKETDTKKRKAARDAARNSLAWDAWTESQANIAGMKLSGLAAHPKGAIGNVKGVLGQLRERGRESFGERVSRMLDGNAMKVRLSGEEKDELRSNGYGKLSELFTPKDEKKEGNAVDASVDGEATPLETVAENKTFDGYAAMEKLMDDTNVSQSTRAKAYYILTGHMLPKGTVMAWERGESDNGDIIVKSKTADGEIVTMRRFKSRQAADREIENIKRQSELNTIEVGERYYDATVADHALQAAIEEVMPGASPNRIRTMMKAVEDGTATEAEVQFVGLINEALERNTADHLSSEGLRNNIKDETGVDVDKALCKKPSARTEDEQAAVNRYKESLYPEEARKQAQAGPEAEAEPAANPYDFDEPTPEQSDAQQAYIEGQKLIEAYHDPSDPAKQEQARANADAIALQMQEAFQLVHEDFDTFDNPDEWKDRLAADPWEVLNDPELPAQMRDNVLYYINSKAALDGIMDASHESTRPPITELPRFSAV